MTFKKNLLLAVSLLSLGALTACGSASTDDTAKPATSVTQQKVMDKATIYGSKKESFYSVESQYKKTPNDALTAARYAKVLREKGDLQQATNILAPLLNKKNTPTLAYTEQAALFVDKGNFAAAEAATAKAVKADAANFRAYHIMGVAQDAQQKHVEAEKSFRKALELWQGDAIPVMNNLALNLAAQGYTDKALEMLYKAKEKDGSRVEIERNIRIIRTLSEPGTPMPRKYDPNKGKV